MRERIERDREILQEDLRWFRRQLELTDGPLDGGDLRWIVRQLEALAGSARQLMKCYQELRCRLDNEAPFVKGDLRLIQVAREQGTQSALYKQRVALGELRATRKTAWIARRMGSTVEPGSVSWGRRTFVRTTLTLREERGI